MIKIFFKLFLLTMLLLTQMSYAAINIVAAENFYGDVAKKIGGDYVDVTNIINNPTQDPHLFNINSSIVKKISQADILIFNGANYDPWIKPFISKNNPQQQIIIVSELVNLSGDKNPHIWYSPDTMPAYAKKITDILVKQDPTHTSYFLTNLNHFNNEYKKLYALINQLRSQFNNIDIIATEPVFNYMAESLGLRMHGQHFQENMMNDLPPTPSQIKEFITDLKQHRVHLVIYNNQVDNPMTKRMLSIAKQENIPIVGVSEVLPLDSSYIQWMTQQLLDIQNALQTQHGK